MGVYYYLIDHIKKTRFELGAGPWGIEKFRFERLLNDSKNVLVNELNLECPGFGYEHCELIIKNIKKFLEGATVETFSMMADCSVEYDASKYLLVGSRYNNNKKFSSLTDVSLSETSDDAGPILADESNPVIRNKFDLKVAVDSLCIFQAELVSYSFIQDVQHKVKILRELGSKLKALGNLFLLVTEEELKPEEKKVYTKKQQDE